MAHDVVLAGRAYTGDDGDLSGSVMATNDTNHVWVYTQNQANTSGANHAYWVAVLP